jgi:hypothetical protein
LSFRLVGLAGAWTQRSGALVCQFGFEFGEAFQQLGVLGVTGRLEVGDHRGLLGRVAERDPQ